MYSKLTTETERSKVTFTAQKMLSIKDFFSKCDTFTEEILNRKIHFLCANCSSIFAVNLRIYLAPYSAD